MTTTKKVFGTLFFVSFFFTAFTENISLNLNTRKDLKSIPSKMNYKDYLASYGFLAVQSMQKHKIPASIIIAQGMLETSYGNSSLAKIANNHFGIKCGDSWNGTFIRHDDDQTQECFRVYSSVKESYLDHGQFIKTRPWYIPLFKLELRDYHKWAKGLQDAGYATDPDYAKKLITLIERYNLYQLDYM